MAMALVLQRTLDKRLACLAELAAEAEDFLAGAGVAAADVFKVQLALEETVRNLILHAVGARSDQFMVRLELGAGRIELVLEDDGQPFDPRSAPPYDPSRPLEERQPNGMGVYLLQQFMDEIHYERSGELNRLRLVVARG